ncbi:hypothetical protein [Luteococcus peritonei]|uniref:Serine acetyltransferase n=1 Tax=Luteococcus peritonei TaxID=88874 RepID=A0ABW4RSE3_9ACTN
MTQPYPYGEHRLVDVVRADLAANRREPASQLLLLGLRGAQWTIGRFGRRHPVAMAATVASRFLSEIVLKVELRPATVVGPGLTIYHRTGLVVNDHAVIGSGVKLRHGITIGHQRADGPSPVIEDGVEIGASALILGGVTVGGDAVVAAGAVVTKDVAPGSVVAGNPAKPLERRPEPGIEQ